MEENKIIKRFAEVQNIDYNTANEMIGAETDEEILKNISNYTVQKIKSNPMPLNRAQRRALQKKTGKKNFDSIIQTAKKLDYIDLIQKLRELNEKQEKEIKEYEDATQEN